jgi:hypothetical protein
MATIPPLPRGVAACVRAFDLTSIAITTDGLLQRYACAPPIGVKDHGRTTKTVGVQRSPSPCNSRKRAETPRACTVSLVE